jgi:hypothetical protein
LGIYATLRVDVVLLRAESERWFYLKAYGAR